jgi:F-type H+-transporting ATPase subunit gamma
MALKHIKLKILSVKKTSTVTRAMEAVSAVKMRKAQERALGGRAYAAAALSILERISGTVELKNHPLAVAREGKTAVLIITSDKGLAGALNSAVIRSVERELVNRNLTPANSVLLSIGRRGGDYFANRGYDVREKHENLADGVSESDVRRISEKILSWHTAGEIGTCLVVYQNFLSTFEQKPVVRQIVPVQQETIHALVKGIAPAKGRYAGMSDEAVTLPAGYVIEPNPEAVFSELLPRLLNIAVFHALLEAKASEHSARMVAMKSATDKAKEMARTLTRKFNKVRQAAITREVSEIVGGIEAMK